MKDSFAHEEHFVKTECADRAVASGIVDESGSVGENGVVDSVLSQPSLRPTSLTLRAHLPTCLVIQRPARSLITSRGAPVRRSTSVHEPFGQSRSGHRNRRLCQRSRAGRPNAGRSTNSTTLRSFTWATTPHSGQPTVASRSSVSIRNGPSGSSSTPRTFTSGRPTRSSHMRVASVSTGVLPIRLLSLDHSREF